jgi:hypothetical protein
MSIEQPVHLADFDYRDSEQIKKYVFAMNQMKEMNNLWTVIETKVLVLTELKNVDEIALATKELEELRSEACLKTAQVDTLIKGLLPNPPVSEQP